MSQYRTIPEWVDAVQCSEIIRESKYDVRNLPRWVSAAMGRFEIEVMENFVTVNVPLKKTQRTIGDWLVKWSNGEFEFINDEAFHRKFEK